jgi:tetratricopeptide (TPR) repeat protein
MRRRLQTLLPTILIVATILVVYGRSASFDFVEWDDDKNILENPYLRPVNAQNIIRIWSAPYLYLYAPVSYTFYAAQALLSRSLSHSGPLEPPTAEVFHAFNLFLHIGSSLLVFCLLRLVLQRPWAAGLGAILFALHPLQAEPVCWITEQRGLLAAALGLGSVLVLLKAETKGRQRTKSVGAMITATVLFLLALLAKPSAASIPLIALVFMYLRGDPIKKHAVSLGLWLLLGAACMLYTKHLQPDRIMNYEVPAWARLFIAGDALGFYIWKILWPFNLSPNYGRTPLVVLHAWWGYATWLLPAIALLLPYLLHRSRSLIGPAPALLLVLPLLPVLGLVPFGYQNWSTVADRYAYLAMLGPALALGIAVEKTQASRRLVIPIAILLGALGMRAFDQSAYWRSSDALFTRTIEVNPDSAIAHNYFGAVAGRAGDFETAADHLRKAQVGNPRSAQVWSNLGMLAAKQGLISEAKEHFDLAIELSPDLAPAHNNRALALKHLGDMDAAVAGFQHTITLDPTLAMPWINLGIIHAERDELSESVRHLETGLHLEPANTMAQSALQQVRTAMRQP